MLEEESRLCSQGKEDLQRSFSCDFLYFLIFLSCSVNKNVVTLLTTHIPYDNADMTNLPWENTNCYISFSVSGCLITVVSIFVCTLHTKF